MSGIDATVRDIASLARAFGVLSNPISGPARIKHAVRYKGKIAPLPKDGLIWYRGARGALFRLTEDGRKVYQKKREGAHGVYRPRRPR